MDWDAVDFSTSKRIPDIPPIQKSIWVLTTLFDW